MPLRPGSRLGPYEIVSSIGAGGMGEVYRARDTKLNRDVAIKVLPELFASDIDRLARFEREAQAVAALSHPNILAIHDFDTTPGASYAVMELLEGETLRARLTAGPLSPRKAAEYASQIARGLAAAHEKGITHRDLKPENVFVTTGGHVKILDFGLARHAGPAAGGDRTMTVGTDPGTVMGTVGYMSPEQVRGEPVDHRSDIFSFGAVLYEMLTGRRAFSRDTAAETMTAILHDDPPELVETGRSIPPALDRLVRHCLEKRPEERFQSARDLAFDLQSTDSGPAPIPKQPVRSRRTMIAVGTLLLSVVGAFLAGRLTTSRGRPSEWHGAGFRPVTIGQAAESWPSLAPDGKSFIYSSAANGNPDIYSQRIGGHNATNLTTDSPDADDQPAFSPDGNRVAFHSAREGGGIFVMGATGESVRRLSDFGYTPSWSPDGQSLVVSDATFEFPQSRPALGKLWVISVASGAKRALPTADAVQPAWSPDGSRIAYWGNGEGGRRDIWTIAADGSGAPLPVTSDAAIDWSPVWSPDGMWLYFSSNRNGTMNIWRIAIEQATGRVAGDPSAVVVPAASVGAFSISKDGKTLLYGTETVRTTLHATTFDSASGRFGGSPQVVLQGAQQIDYIDVSPDGRWIAFGSADRQEDLFLVRTDGTGFRQITDDPYRDRGPRWSPDGSRLAFYSNRQGPYQIWAIRPDGSRLELLARAPSSATGLVRPSWSPDGRQLSAKDMQVGPILINLDLPLETRAQAWSASADPGIVLQAWSPDGRRIAAALEQGPDSVKVFVGSVDGKIQVVHTATAQVWEGSLAWLSDSVRLLFTTRAGGINLLDSITGQSREVFPKPRGPVQLPMVAISRDNRVAAYVEMRSEGDLWVMEAKQ